MSEISKAIMARDTGERRSKPTTSRLFQDVFSMKENYGKTLDFEVLKVYKIGVTLGNTCAVSELESDKNSNAYGEAILRTKRQVIEAIFGEFRPHFRLIEKAIYDYDYHEAGRLLHEMERQMYEPE